jgi:hypothetical protein
MTTRATGTFWLTEIERLPSWLVCLYSQQEHWEDLLRLNKSLMICVYRSANGAGASAADADVLKVVCNGTCQTL